MQEGKASRRKFLTASSSAAIAGLVGCLGGGEDEEYPSQPITWIVPAGEGGGTDLYTRMFAPIMSDILGVDTSVENNPGPTPGVIAEVDQEESDGYTLISLNPPFEIIQYLAEPTDHHVNDIEGIAHFATAVYVVFSNPDEEIQDYADLSDRYEDGELDSIGGQEHGGIQHLISLLMRDTHNIPWESYVPYDGSGEVASAVAQGEVPVGIGTEDAVQPFEEDDNVEVIAATHSDGTSVWPDIDTVTDHGFENIDYAAAQNRTFSAPEGTPEDRLQVLADAVEEAIQTDEAQEWAEETGSNLEFYGGPDHVENLREEAFENMQEQVDLDALRE